MTPRISGKWLKPVLVVLAAAALIVVVVVTRSPDVSPNPEELNHMGETIEAPDVQSYRSTLSGTSTNRGKTTESYLEAAFTAPDRYHIKMTEDGDVSEFIAIGDTHYIKSSELSPNVMRASTQSVSYFITPKYSLDLLDSLREPEALPMEEISGVECFHYRGAVDMERQWEEMKASLDPSQPGYEDRLEMMETELERIRQSTIEYELWIGKEDLLIRQTKYSGRTPSEEDEQWVTSMMTMQLFDINQPIVIEAPLDAQGELLPGWQLSEDYTPGIGFTGELDYEITGDDPAHKQVSVTFTVTNIGMEMANNINVSFRSITSGSEDVDSWVEAVPSASGVVDLEPGESETFSGSYECDTTHIDARKFEELVKMTRARITYTTPAGHEQVKFVSGGAPYPTAVPPEEPPDQKTD